MEQALLQLSVSRISQAIHRLGPVDEAWRDILVDSPLFRSQQFDGIALERARILINTEYGVGGLDKTIIAKTVEDVLARKPFFCAINVGRIFCLIYKS
jgi:hypothetical protein